MRPNCPKSTLRLAVIILAAGGWVGIGEQSAQADDASAMRHESLIIVGDRIFIEAGEDVSEIGEITIFCLGCHDGATGPARQTPELRPAGGTSCTGLPGVHPVGARYPTGSMKFSDPESLPSSMYMSDGCLTCVTCHDLLLENHGLVVSNRRSALCLTCHRK